MKKVVVLILLAFAGMAFAGQKRGFKYPVPEKTKNRLFYIQRNHNRNTIVYDANFDNEGNLVSDNPVKVYWIRYEEKGQTMELRTVEKIFAYGVKCKPVAGKSGQYDVNLVATDTRRFILKQTAPFKAAVYMNIGGKEAVLNHIYFFADESGWWPEVKYIEFFGSDASTGKEVYEKLVIDD